MNPLEEQPFDESIDNELDGQIDRLVDGELSTDQLRDLVEILESTPNGWKHCAIRFIEQQQLQQDFVALVQGECGGQTESRPVVEIKRKAYSRSVAAGWVALIVLLLLAPFAWHYFAGGIRGNVPVAPPVIVDNEAPNSRVPKDGVPVADGKQIEPSLNTAL
jgi:hypothetical protein